MKDMDVFFETFVSLLNEMCYVRTYRNKLLVIHFRMAERMSGKKTQKRNRT